MSGRLTSSSTRSNGPFVSAAFRHSVPVPASMTSNVSDFSASRIVLMRARVGTWSSTQSTFLAIRLPWAGRGSWGVIVTDNVGPGSGGGDRGNPLKDCREPHAWYYRVVKEVLRWV